MKLLQLCAGQLRLGQPLPWNVRMDGGELLLSKGYVITEERQLQALLDRGMYVDQDEYERHRRQRGEDAAGQDRFSVWGDLARKTSALLREPEKQPRFAVEMDALGARVQDAARRDPDIGSFELAHLTHVAYPVLHSLHAAYLAALVGQRLELDNAQQHSAVCAALTMNIAMLPLQAALCLQRHALTDTQREQIRSHPQRGVALLRSLGVTDADWLEAVAQHHERDDGGGYPEGRQAVHPLAQLIRHCDVYLAKLGGRASRPPLPVHQAARQFFQQHEGERNPIAAALIKETGLYPPGTYVKLANGELAVVVRRGAGATTPQVCSLVDGIGMAFPEPVPRDTARPTHKVLSPVPAANVRVRIERHRLFGLR